MFMCWTPRNVLGARKRLTQALMADMSAKAMSAARERADAARKAHADDVASFVRTDHAQDAPCAFSRPDEAPRNVAGVDWHVQVMKRERIHGPKRERVVSRRDVNRAFASYAVAKFAARVGMLEGQRMILGAFCMTVADLASEGRDVAAAMELRRAIAYAKGVVEGNKALADLTSI